MNRLSHLSPSTLAAFAAAAPTLALATLWAIGVSGGALVGLTALAAVLAGAVFGRAALIGRRRLATPILDAGRDVGIEDADAGRILGRLRHELHALRASLADADDRFELRSAVIEALDAPILALAPDGRVLLANSAACAFLRIDRPRLIGSAIGEVIAQPPILAAARAALAGEPLRHRLDLSTHAGPRVYDVSAGPVRFGAGPDAGALLILRDVTRLARAAQMKTDFVANASHELRTPLAAIRAALDTALAADDDPELLKKFVGMAPTHMRRLEELTRDLIDLSRLEGPEPVRRVERLAAAEMVQSLRALHGDAARERDVSIEFDLAPEVDGFLTDPRLVHLVLKNLLDNALKFCREGSTVRVCGAVDGEARDGPRRARFEVRDRGVGVPLDEQHRVFERFYQVDPARTGAGGARRGTGLGLSIVKHAAAALGGEAGLESVYGEGTTVWLEIPELTADEPG